MGLYDKLTGKATMSTDGNIIKEFLIENEEVIASYKFIRDSIILTTCGIYMIDVQGISGKKVETKFFPSKNIKSVSFETAGTLDMDVDIKIGVEGNTAFTTNGVPFNAPISFKVPKAQSQQAREIISQVKKYYLCK